MSGGAVAPLVAGWAPVLDPLAGYAVPSDAEVAQARSVRGRIVVADRRDQWWARAPVVTALIVVLVGAGQVILATWRLWHWQALGPAFAGFYVAVLMCSLALVNVAVVLVSGRKLLARSRNWRGQLMGPRFPDRVPVQPVLTSSPGLATLLVAESARTVRPERLAEVLGMPVQLASQWVADLTCRGLLSTESASGMCLITPAGRLSLDRVLGPRP